MVRQGKRRRGAPAPVVEYISLAPAVTFPVVESIPPVPAVFQASSPVVAYFAPAPAVFQAPTPVVKSIAPVPAVFQAPTPVVKSIAPVPAVFHASVFPLSPDASDVSSSEDEHTNFLVSLPVAIETNTQVESAEPLNLASET